MNIDALNELPQMWDKLSEAEQRQILAELESIEDELLDWHPLPGPQTQAFYSDADILFYGGAAGGGKTDLILGLAHKSHRKTIIFRREYKQLKGIIERGKELFDNRSNGKFNAVQNFWRLRDNRLIELGACQHLGDEQKHQGIAHDLKAFDEITHYHESQFKFLCGWLRSTDKHQRKRIVCAGNPPTNAEGDWVIKYWAPWLDDHHPNPALPGELRWYTTVGVEDVEMPSGDPFEYDGDILVPKSRTFIPAKIEDNPFLMEAGYKAQLQSLPEPLRSKMLKGDFAAGREDDAWQVIPTQWVLLAQKRWRETTKPDVSMSALGVDVARGGADKTCITPRYNTYFDKQLTYPGRATPDGQSVAGLVSKERKNDSLVIVDVIGVGASVFDFLRAQANSPDKRAAIIGFNSAHGSAATDKSKQLTFINQRAEWYWKFREALDPVSGLNLALPDDRELLADLCAPRWEFTPRGIKIESKEDIIDRIGRSPDKGDACIYAFVTPTKRAPYSTNINIMGR